MRSRYLRAYAVAILTVLGCSSGDREATDTRARQGTPTDTAPEYTTHEMSEGLSEDVRKSDYDLAELQDSIYRSVGDSLTAVLEQARTSWERYRKLECDALGLVFAGGTMGPIAELECWVALTDSRRRFLGEQYEFIRPARATSTSSPR